MTAKRSADSLTHGLCALALALSSQVALATPQWEINPEGTGLGGASTVATLNVGGVGFVQIVPDANGGSAFSFVEHGAYQVLKPDMLTPFGATDLTVSYSISGIGNSLDPLGLHFTSGRIDLYADPRFDFATAAVHYGVDNGTRIAAFDVFDGGMTGSGLVTVNAKIVTNSLLAGYFFGADGSDLAGNDDVLMQLGIFNQPTIPDSLLISGVVCGIAAYPGPGCDGTPFTSSPLAFTVRDGGFATLSSVPEPATLSLLLVGVGLIGGTRKRRRSAAR